MAVEIKKAQVEKTVSLDEMEEAVGKLDQITDDKSKAKAKALKQRISREELSAKDRRLAILSEGAKDAVKTNTILKGQVVSVQPKKIGGVLEACLTLNYDDKNPDVKVLIPYRSVFMSPPQLESEQLEEDFEEEKHYGDVTVTKNKQQCIMEEQMRILRQMLGAQIRYVPLSVKEDRKKGIVYILGDRSKGLAIERHYYYERENPNIKDHEIYRDARVVAVWPSRALICLGGYEKMMPLTKLTNRYCPDAEDYFMAGQKISVMVREIKVEVVNGARFFKEAEFDCLTGEIADNIKNIKAIVSGEQAFGTISKIVSYADEDGNPKHKLFGWADCWNLPIRFTKVPANRHGRPHEIGDRVVFEALSVASDGYISGRIVRLVGVNR